MATNLSERLVIALPDEIKGGAGIEFLFVEISKFFPAMPFAVVHYEENGKRVPLGLRLDLDKRVFLDHFDDGAKEEVLNRAAPKICAFVGPSRQGKDRGHSVIISAYTLPESLVSAGASPVVAQRIEIPVGISEKKANAASLSLPWNAPDRDLVKTESNKRKKVSTKNRVRKSKVSTPIPILRTKGQKQKVQSKY
jgi:hypothetical protein